MITLSKDGYVRLTLATMQNTPFVHLLSGLDEEHVGPPLPRVDACGISGYTEWISSTTPVMTIGWDWRLEVSRGRPRYVRAGLPRSNLMFLDAEQRDLGFARTVALLKVAVDAIGWEQKTKKAISDRYAGTTCQV